MPQAVAAVAAWWTTVAYAGITYGTYVTLAVAIYGSVQQRRSARKMANAARDAYNAGLMDRTVNIVAADNPWQVVYGKATVGGSVAAMLTSGSRDEYKHLLMVWASHECEAIDDFLVNGESVGPLDASGYVQPGSKWWRTATAVEYETLVVSGSGTLTLAHPVDRVTSVGYTVVTLEGQTTSLIEDVGSITISSNVLTLPVPFNTDWAGLTVTVNYEWTRAAPVLRVRHHLGSASQVADTDLIAAALPGEWTATDRGRGLCYSWVEFNLNEPEFQGGPPQCTATVRGKKVYDPRLDSTQPGGSGAHRADTPSTWAYSTNNALCIADFLRGEYGKAAPTAHVQWPTVQAAANVCDTAVTYGALTQALYTCNGSFRTDQDPDATLDQLCQSMAGFATHAGTWLLTAGAYNAPVMALTDADNMGPVEVIPAAPLEETMNGLRGRFYDAQRFNQVTDYTPYQNTAFVTADGQPLWENLDLPFTDSNLRAHQLCRVQVERSRGMALVFPAKLRAVRLLPGQRVTLSNSLLGITAAVFRVVKREFTPGGPVNLHLVQDAASHYDLVDAPAPISVPTSVQPNPFRVDLVTGLTATTGGEALVRDPDGNVITRVTLNYTASADELVRTGGGMHIETRIHDEPVWQRHPNAPGDSTSQQLRGLRENRLYLVQVRWFNSLGSVGDWRSLGVLTDSVARAPVNLYTASVAGPVNYSNVS